MQAVQSAHNTAHGYIGGTLGRQHFSFHDPFVFLLHSNQDRLWAMWQLAPGKDWRLDPNQVYGNDGTAPSITANLEPWSGGTGLRPWAPPDNQQVVKTCKHPSVVKPPSYDTDPLIGRLLNAQGTVTLLRVHDVGTGYGPPTDFIDVEVVIGLDSQPDKAFGFQLRGDANEEAHRGMLDLLRDAFNEGRRVNIDYFHTGMRTGRVIRVW